MSRSATRQGVIPKKHLGQHFLADPNVRSRIIEHCNLKETETVLEIGPGLGALTKDIACRVQNLYAVEKDTTLGETLKKNLPENVTVIQGDILKYDLGLLPAGIKVIGNLPYYISSPIMEKILTHRPMFTDIFFTVQLEFGQRLTAKLNTKDYSALTCFVQYHADAKILFKISPSAFSPSPKVMSCFVHLKPRGPATQAKDPDRLFKIIHHAFQQRRKKIANALTSLWDKEKAEALLKEAGIDGELRPENIPLKNYIRLANTAVK